MSKSAPHITGRYAILAAIISGSLGMFGVVINNYLNNGKEKEQYEYPSEGDNSNTEKNYSASVDNNSQVFYQKVLSAEESDYQICERFLLMTGNDSDFQSIFKLLERRKLQHIFDQNFSDDKLFIALSEYIVDFPNTNELSRILRILKDLDRKLPFGEKPEEKLSWMYDERLECIVTYQGPIYFQGERVDNKLDRISTDLIEKLVPYSNIYNDFDQVDIEYTLSRFIVNVSVDSGNKTEVVRKILVEFREGRKNFVKTNQKELSRKELEIRTYFSNFPTFLICSNSWEDRPAPPPAPSME